MKLVLQRGHLLSKENAADKDSQRKRRGKRKVNKTVITRTSSAERSLAAQRKAETKCIDEDGRENQTKGTIGEGGA